MCLLAKLEPYLGQFCARSANDWKFTLGCKSGSVITFFILANVQQLFFMFLVVFLADECCYEHIEPYLGWLEKLPA